MKKIVNEGLAKIKTAKAEIVSKEMEVLQSRHGHKQGYFSLVIKFRKQK